MNDENSENISRSDSHEGPIPWSSVMNSANSSPLLFEQGAQVNFIRHGGNYEKVTDDNDDIKVVPNKNSPLTVHLPNQHEHEASIQQENMDENEEEQILFCHSSFELTISDDRYNDTEEETSSSPPLAECQNVKGEIIVTTRRILFAVEQYQIPEQLRYDLSIHACLIGLFALSNKNNNDSDEDEDEVYQNDDDTKDKYPTDENLEEEISLGQCIYVQFNVPNSSGKTQPIEVYFVPSSSLQEESTKKVLNELFHALSHTAELNPPLEDDEDEDGYGYGYSEGAGDGFFGLDTGEGFCMRLDDDNNNQEEEHEQQRADLLEKLDNMLIVPSELEKEYDGSDHDDIQGGQFDDAEEDDDLL